MPIKATHQDDTNFDTPIKTGDSQGNRPADNKGTGNPKGEKKEKVKGVDTSKVKTEPAGKVAEEIEALFKGVEGLSEDFIMKASILFESAVSEKIENIKSEMATDFETKLNESYEDEATSLEESLDGYLDLFVSTYLEENKLALEEGFKNDLSNTIMENVANIVEMSGIELPTDKIDIAEALTEELAEVEEKLNDNINENIELTKRIKTFELNEAFNEGTQGLSEIVKDKLKKLTENVEYKDVETFVEKLDVLKESIANTKTSNTSTTLNESATPLKESKDDGLSDIQKMYLNVATL